MSHLLDWSGSLIRRPRLAMLVGVLVCLLGYLAWLGGCDLWVRWDRKKAVEALAEFDFDEARRRLAQCVRMRPADAELRLLAARTARRDGDLDFAEDQLEAYHELVGGSSSQETLERALRRAQQGKVHEVIDQLIEALEVRHPQSEQILESLTMGCVESYQLSRATFWGSELLDKWPKNAIGRLFHAETVDTQGHRDKAIASIREVVRDFPKFYKARLSLAGILFKAQRYREAIPEYAALLRQRPGELLPLVGLASSYDRDGATDNARPLLEELEKRHPDNSEVLLLSGRFALREERLADAERILRRALALSPNDHEIHRELGVCLSQLGRGDEAKEHLDRFKQIEADLIRLEKCILAMGKSPNDPAPRREAGEICLRNGQVAEGLRWLTGVLDGSPNDKATHKIMADFFASQGDERSAAFHALKAR